MTPSLHVSNMDSDVGSRKRRKKTDRKKGVRREEEKITAHFQKLGANDTSEASQTSKSVKGRRIDRSWFKKPREEAHTPVNNTQNEQVAEEDDITQEDDADCDKNTDEDFDKNIVQVLYTESGLGRNWNKNREVASPLLNKRANKEPASFKTSTPVHSQIRYVPVDVNLSVSEDENNAGESETSLSSVEAVNGSILDKNVDRQLMKKFRNMTIYHRSMTRRSTEMNVEWWVVNSCVLDELWNIKVNTVDGLFTYARKKLGLTLQYDKSTFIINEGLARLYKLWDWLHKRDMRRGIKRKTDNCMDKVTGAPTKFPRLMGWKLHMCRLVSSLSMQVFVGENQIVLEEFIKDWGKVDWLDTAGNEIISQLEAGEVMDLLMSSESFGSSNSNVNDGRNSLRDDGAILLNEEIGGEDSASGVSQDVLSENVSEVLPVHV